MGSRESLGFIFTRYYGGTFIARFQGKVASCTSGRKAAAERVARKVLGQKPYSLRAVAGGDTFFELLLCTDTHTEV